MTHRKKWLAVDIDASTQRPMQTGIAWTPRVSDLEDGYIIYNVLDRVSRPTGPDLLREFLLLPERDDTAIFRFAKRWGALGVGEDGWPGQDGWPMGLRHKHVSAWESYYKESVSAWRRVAMRFRAAINISAQLAQGRPGLEQDWKDLDTKRYANAPILLAGLRGRRYGISVGRTELEVAIRQMIDRYRVAPRFWWNNKTEQWQIDLDTLSWSNLPGLITIQALIVIADKEGFAICSSCHKAYFPPRKPDPTRRNYCQKCGKRAAWRDSQRQRRQRDRERRSNGSEGADAAKNQR